MIVESHSTIYGTGREDNGLLRGGELSLSGPALALRRYSLLLALVARLIRLNDRSLRSCINEFVNDRLLLQILRPCTGFCLSIAEMYCGTPLLDPSAHPGDPRTGFIVYTMPTFTPSCSGVVVGYWFCYQNASNTTGNEMLTDDNNTSSHNHR